MDDDWSIMLTIMEHVLVKQKRKSHLKYFEEFHHSCLGIQRLMSPELPFSELGTMLHSLLIFVPFDNNFAEKL